MKPLPPAAAAVSAVGDLTMGCTEPLQKNGGPVTFDAVLSGRGNVRAASAPGFASALAGDVQRIEGGVSLDRGRATPAMIRRWKYMIFPAASGVLRIPQLEMPIFDPATGSRQVLRCESTALEVSAYSLVALARRAAPLMEKKGGGSILTLTYLGSDRVFTNYNVMGVAKAALESSVRYLASDLGPKNIRVNAISAGPIKTLAAAGISGFSSILQHYRDRAPLRRTVETSEVADAAIFLLGPAGKGVTGEVMMVDGGYHAMGI